MPWSYANLDEFKDRLGITTNPADAISRMALEDAARQIDEFTHRTFRVHLATRYYTPEDGNYQEVDDLLAITTLKTDEDGDRTYEKTWATTDYDLTPYNAAIAEKPYTRLEVTPEGTLAFPRNLAKSVEINGRWGFFQRTSSVGTLGAAISSATATSVTMASGHSVQPLMTLLIDSEQLYVTAVSGDTLTVERGVNGTTAATHSNAAAVSKYDYHPSIVEAAIIQASRGIRNADSPFGVVGTTEFGTTFVRAALDPRTTLLLRPFMRGSAWLL